MSINPGPSVTPRAALACCSPGEVGNCVQSVSLTGKVSVLTWVGCGEKCFQVFTERLLLHVVFAGLRWLSFC